MRIIRKLWTALLLDGCDDSRDVQVGDLDGDGISDDLVLPCKSRDRVYIVKNGTSWLERGVSLPRSVAICDFTGDGLSDVVVGSSRRNLDVFVAPNFTKRIVRSPKMTNALVCFDVDRDGRLDVVFAAQEDNRVGWTTIEGKVKWFRPQFKNLHSVVAFNGGFVALDNYLAPVFLNSTTSYFIDERHHAGGRDACAVDVDGDGLEDLVVAYKFADEVSWYDSGRGGERRVVGLDCDFACGLACTDIDGDNLVDILVTEKNSDTLTLFIQRRSNDDGIWWERYIVLKAAAPDAVRVFKKYAAGLNVTLALASRGCRENCEKWQKHLASDEEAHHINITSGSFSLVTIDKSELQFP